MSVGVPTSERLLCHALPRVACLGRPAGAETLLEAGLSRVRSALAREGIDVPPLSGQLLRPRAALYMVPPNVRPTLPDRFWLGCLAIQMVHEASLLHDDVIDAGHERRGRATVAASSGCDAALLLGDLYLTGAYRVAERVGSPRFRKTFVDAVHETVRGERLQARAAHGGCPLDVLRGKTGALFGAALSLPSDFGGRATHQEARELGIEIGVLYQMVDDFLDYCPSAETGKPALQDFRRRVHTWVVPGPVRSSSGGPAPWFDQSEADVVRSFFEGTSAEPSPAERALHTLREKRDVLVRRVAELGGDLGLAVTLMRWVRACEAAYRQEVPGAVSTGRVATVAARTGGQGELPPDAGSGGAGWERWEDPARVVRDLALGVGDPDDWDGYFRAGSRSFSLAAALFPRAARRLVTGIYAFCRFTDDLVDEAPVDDPVWISDALDAWADLCRSRYAGEETEIPLVDVVVGAMRAGDVPLEYALELIRGVGMDVRHTPFPTMDDLRLYTYRVASVVGGWMTRSFGVGDPWVLDRAYALGHAMQLTNILRDVGEDLDRGRLYLPLQALDRRGLTPADLSRMHTEGWISPAYREVIEDLMSVADEGYRMAFEGLPHVPPFFARPVAAAARIYQGIHDGIRRNGYDNLMRRARTGRLRKIVLVARGLTQLRGQRSAVSDPRPLLTGDMAETG